MWQKPRFSPASGGRSFHGRNIMFTKCANWNCPQQFRYFRGAMVFRVETQPGSESGSGKPSVDPLVEYHWLCAECLHVILISLEDHGAGTGPLLGTAREPNGRIVRLTSLDAALAELAKTENWTQTLTLAQSMALAQTTAGVVAENPPEIPGSEQLSTGALPTNGTGTHLAPESGKERDSSAIKVCRDDKKNDQWNDERRGLSATL
jgi:hypothetical protein